MNDLMRQSMFAIPRRDRELREYRLVLVVDVGPCRRPNQSSIASTPSWLSRSTLAFIA